MKMLRRVLSDRQAASAVEFAMVLPILLLLLLGIIDVGRLMYVWNMAEKATQMGVRYAVVTDMVPSNLAIDFTTSHNLVGGDPVPTNVFSSTTCNTTNCTPNWGYNATAYNAIVTRMNRFYPAIGGESLNRVTIRYENVGLGYAGDPSGPDVAALVTVRLQNMTFRPWSMLGYPITLPSFSAALTMEDSAGTVSN
jgi:Flp pilus assembly protein TadG